MTLRERLGLDRKPDPKPPVPEWVKRAQENRLAVKQTREGATT
jgi:hypothetical protein